MWTHMRRRSVLGIVAGMMLSVGVTELAYADYLLEGPIQLDVSTLQNVAVYFHNYLPVQISGFTVSLLYTDDSPVRISSVDVWVPGQFSYGFDVEDDRGPALIIARAADSSVDPPAKTVHTVATTRMVDSTTTGYYRGGCIYVKFTQRAPEGAVLFIAPEAAIDGVEYAIVDGDERCEDTLEGDGPELYIAGPVVVDISTLQNCVVFYDPFIFSRVSVISGFTVSLLHAQAWSAMIASADVRRPPTYLWEVVGSSYGFDIKDDHEVTRGLFRPVGDASVDPPSTVVHTVATNSKIDRSDFSVVVSLTERAAAGTCLLIAPEVEVDGTLFSVFYAPLVCNRY